MIERQPFSPCSAMLRRPPLDVNSNRSVLRCMTKHVGIVHYSYSASVLSKGSPTVVVTGKWTEVYLRQAGEWIMIAVSGRPDVQETRVVSNTIE
jgi:hypothetical protein